MGRGDVEYGLLIEFNSLMDLCLIPSWHEMSQRDINQNCIERDISETS